MVSILGIDHGEVRIGLAVSDALGLLAHPLETIETKKTDAVARIAEIVKQRSIDTIVLGMPFRMDGSEGTAVEKVREFEARLREIIGEDIRYIHVDERLSTVTAQGQLHASGRKAKNSRAVIDQAAAVVILQDYLDTLAPSLPEDVDDPDDDE